MRTRGSLLFAVLSCGCSFPDYVADLDASVQVDDSATTSDVASGDTCRSPCGCGAPIDAAVVVDGSPGQSCGPCKTGKLACVGPSLTCSVSDDRSTVADSGYAGSGMGSFFRQMRHTEAIAIGFPLHRVALPYSLQLTLNRTPYVCPSSTTPTNPDPACDKCTFDSVASVYNCTVSKPIDGQLVIRAMHGQPTDAAPTTIGSVTVPTVSIPSGFGATTPTTLVFPIDPSTTPLPVSTSVYLEITTDSTAWTIVLDADRTKRAAPPSDLTLWSRTTTPASPWTVEVTAGGGTLSAIVPLFTFNVRGCF